MTFPTQLCRDYFLHAFFLWIQLGILTAECFIATLSDLSPPFFLGGGWGYIYINIYIYIYG